MVIINAAWGLGENVVQGTVNPDEYTVFKPLLGNDHFRPIIEKILGDKDKNDLRRRRYKIHEEHRHTSGNAGSMF